MKILQTLLASFIIVFLFLVNSRTVSAETTIFKPPLTWQRSTEASDKVVQETVLGSKINDARSLTLDPNQIVFDDGISTPQVNKNAVASGISWASWVQYSSSGTTCGPIYDLRHFQAKFNLSNTANIQKILLRSPYYLGNIFPINDNAYIFINGNFIKRLGTSYGARNIGFDGRAPYANETDGWIADGDLGATPAQYLHTGENILDIVAGETCRWGGMGKLELVLEIEGPVPSPTPTPLPVPYFSQKDPRWGSQEYDHANSLSLDCGTTLAQCGCATTSAAMILKYYGVDKSPTGEPTNPETLNNWLKNRSSGYNNGDLNWLDITKYAMDANATFDTPKIDYIGRINFPDFNTLNDDLNSNKPVILQEPGHFIIATGISGTTYTINDPHSISKTTLKSFSNSFEGLRQYALTNTNLSAILLTIPSPGKILLIDSQRRRLGQDPETDEIFYEIPYGNFYLQAPLSNDTLEDPSIPPEGSGNFYIEVLDPQEDDYMIKIGDNNSKAIFLAYDQNADVNMRSFDIQGTQEFILNYSPELGAQREITQIVGIDIKPGDSKNYIKLNDEQTYSVAILTTPNFDASTVDVESIRFSPEQAKEIHSIKSKSFQRDHFKDIDKDGDKDLVLHFRIRGKGLILGYMQTCLTGKTKTDVLIKGCEVVKVVRD